MLSYPTFIATQASFRWGGGAKPRLSLLLSETNSSYHSMNPTLSSLYDWPLMCTSKGAAATHCLKVDMAAEDLCTSNVVRLVDVPARKGIAHKQNTRHSSVVSGATIQDTNSWPIWKVSACHDGTWHTTRPVLQESTDIRKGVRELT